MVRFSTEDPLLGAQILFLVYMDLLSNDFLTLPLNSLISMECSLGCIADHATYEVRYALPYPLEFG